MSLFRTLRGFTGRLAMVLVLISVGIAVAATTLKVAVPAGVTTVGIDQFTVRIDASDPVIVSLYSFDGTITGQVEPAPGSRSAEVTVTVLGSPNVVIFDGRVTGPSIIDRFLVIQETGRGEN